MSVMLAAHSLGPLDSVLSKRNDIAMVGRWTADNGANIDNTYGVFLNGVWTGLDNQHIGSFGGWSTDIVLNSGFVAGVNTLAFTWSNAGSVNNPGGVRIEFFRSYVPEPASGLFFVFGFGFLMLMRHRCVET